nr:AIPR family protein [Rathayibacter agropyri]
MVPGAWLFDLFAEHKEELFSANVRDYLGSRNSDANINNGIKQTAESEPGDFAVYNNGITALVLSYSVGRRSRASRKLTVRGLSIVNGAQTTGSLGSLPSRPDEGLLVPIRFIKSSDSQLLEKIVRFNNSQNRVQAADFRSGDEVQSRLRSEFAQLKGVSYDGGRRGGASDAMKRSRSAIPHYTAGQVLTAFNGDSVTAYDKKSEIWVDDKLYSSVFGERTTARGILFSYSLYEAISSRRLSLLAKQKSSGEAITTDDANELKFLGKRGASYLLVEAVARVIEIVLEKSVSNKLDLSFDAKVDLSTAVNLWMPLLTSLMPLAAQLDSAFTSGRVKQEGKDVALRQFASMFGSLIIMSEKKFPEFAGRVVYLNN